MSISLSLSMYLMMDHNEKQYRKYLKCIKCVKLHWICCNWRYIVVNQLSDLEQDLNLEAIDEKNETDRKATHRSSVGTVQMPQIETRPNALSNPTDMDV